MDYQQHSSQPVSHYEYFSALNQPDWSVKVRQQSLLAMAGLDGWGSNYKATVLIDLILMMRPEVVVEIGVFGGKSLFPMAYAVKANGNGKVYGIDPWDANESVIGMDQVNHNWWITVDHQAIYTRLVEKIHQFELQSYLELIRTTSANAPLISNIGLLHIDGNHSEEVSYQDLLRWVPMVKKGGVILLDDLGWTYHGIPTLTKAKEWLDENCIKFAEINDEGNSWGLWIKP